MPEQVDFNQRCEDQHLTQQFGLNGHDPQLTLNMAMFNLQYGADRMFRYLNGERERL